MESAVGGYSPGLRGSAAQAVPAKSATATHVAAQIRILRPCLFCERYQCAASLVRRQPSSERLAHQQIEARLGAREPVLDDGLRAYGARSGKIALFDLEAIGNEILG